MLYNTFIYVPCITISTFQSLQHFTYCTMHLSMCPALQFRHCNSTNPSTLQTIIFNPYNTLCVVPHLICLLPATIVSQSFSYGASFSFIFTPFYEFLYKINVHYFGMYLYSTHHFFLQNKKNPLFLMGS